MARTEARESQIRILLHRSGGVCYYPGCGASLDVPTRSSGDQPKNVGKIAHIAAASENGPRYDPCMTDAERSGVENLIYLCGSCHDRIDAQESFHTTEWLRECKEAHESAVRRSVRYSMQKVGFVQLEALCSFLVATSAKSSLDVEDVDLPLNIEEKLVLNRLQDATRDKVRDGIAQSARVANFVQMANETEPRFGALLTAKVQSFYFSGAADGVDGDELFDFVCALTLDHAGPNLTRVLEAAAIAVVAHIFTQCDIFAHVNTAA